MEFNKRKIFKDAGERLVQFRKKFEYSRAQMAAHLGVKRNSYYKNETGLSLPGLETLHQLAMEHNVSMDWFFFNKGSMYYGEKEKEIEELKNQLDQEQKKFLAWEQEKQSVQGAENQKEKKVVLESIKPEIKELIEHMAALPLLYYEILAHYQRFKLENKALLENNGME